MPELEVAGKATADDEGLTFSIPEAGRKVGLGRNASYAAAKRGELPVVWYGRTRSSAEGGAREAT